MTSETLSQRSDKPLVLSWLGVICLIYVMLLAVGLIGTGFKTATGGQAKELFAFAANPFLGLMIGTLATALIQSSSTVTSIIVGLTAGGLPIATAIPMVMGANIGTTITNTLVSLGHIRQRQDFKRAFSAATVHDFFNLIAVCIFLPIEIAFGVLEKLSAYFTSFIVGGDSLSIKGFNFVKPITKPVIGAIKDVLPESSSMMTGVILIALGIGLIFWAITLLGKILKQLMVGRAKAILKSAIGRGPVSGISSGAAVTVLVQSSSTTTSLMIPLVGSGVFTMRDIYPFTLGANIGTTITALLAATAVVGDNSALALQIALVHLLYNVLGVVIIYGVPWLRELPPRMAEKLSEQAEKRGAMVALYILGVFFVFPGLMLLATIK